MAQINNITGQYVSFERPIAQVTEREMAQILRTLSRALGMKLTGRKVGARYVIELDGATVTDKCRRFDSALARAIGRDVVTPH